MEIEWSLVQLVDAPPSWIFWMYKSSLMQRLMTAVPFRTCHAVGDGPKRESTPSGWV
jgi:hypothetical protein